MVMWHDNERVWELTVDIQAKGYVMFPMFGNESLIPFVINCHITAYWFYYKCAPDIEWLYRRSKHAIEDAPSVLREKVTAVH